MYLPMPKQLTRQDGSLAVSAVSLSEKPSNVPVWLYDALKQRFSSKKGMPLTIRCGENERDEAYTLTVSEEGVCVTASGYRGVFYALKTLEQSVRKDGTLPYITVEDAPDLSYRGWYQDVSRGRIPTIETLKRLVDRLSAYKMNSLQLYVEHTHRFACYAGIQEPLGFYTDEEIRELDRYCIEHCVELIPSLSCFGHLYMLLQSPAHTALCELENYHPTRHHWHERLLHHTIDPADPRSMELIGGMIDAYAPLFTSDYFNICCDETFDLCKGKNAGRDVATVYTEFVSALIERLRKHGKTAMMWSDIVLKHPQALSMLPKDVVYLNWCYDANPHGLHAEILQEAGCCQIVCPSVNSHKRFVEKLVYSLPNIAAVTEEGCRHGAMGVLITNWGDYGHVCSDDNVLCGLSYGAAKAWNGNGATEEDLMRAILRHTYRTDAKEVLSIIRTLNICDEIPFPREGYEMALWELTVQMYDDVHTEPADLLYRKQVLRGTPLLQKREDALLCAERLQVMGEDGTMASDVAQSLRLAAQATAVVLGLLWEYAHDRAAGEMLVAETRAWLAAFRDRWHKENVPGEWQAIEDFFERMLAKGIA